jgi:pimeloyl-ACP methyl ester carboxylesterase
MSSARTAKHGFGGEVIMTDRGMGLLVRPAGHAVGTIVMVHGTLDRGGSFTRMARRLEGFDAVAFDRRGYQSSRSLEAASTMADHIADLQAILREVRGSGPITLVGHSFGGVVALAATMALPDDVGSVVVYEPPMPWLWEGGHPHRGVPVDGGAATEVERFFRHMVSDAAWEHLGEDDRADRIADGEGLMSDLRIIRNETPFTMEHVAALEVPMTIVIGDTAPGHRRTAELVVDTAPRGTLLAIEGAPHGAHLSHPDTLAEIVLRQAARSEEPR